MTVQRRLPLYAASICTMPKTLSGKALVRDLHARKCPEIGSERAAWRTNRQIAADRMDDDRSVVPRCGPVGLELIG